MAAEIIQVDSTWLPGIREYNVTLEDIDGADSNRDEGGTAHRDVIRSNVYHADVTHIVQESDFETICGLLKGDAIIEVTALCPGKDSSSATSTFNAYVSKITSQLILYEGQGGAIESWWQINYSLVEV